VDYVLMDSWFLCEKFLQLASSINTDIVAIVKMAKAKYDYQGKAYTAKNLPN